VTIAFKVGVGDLIPEFLAHTFILGRPRQSARTEAARSLQALLDIPDDFLIFIESNLHCPNTSLLS
jgi:hypothetical protein